MKIARGNERCSTAKELKCMELPLHTVNECIIKVVKETKICSMTLANADEVAILRLPRSEVSRSYYLHHKNSFGSFINDLLMWNWKRYVSIFRSNWFLKLLLKFVQIYLFWTHFYDFCSDRTGRNVALLSVPPGTSCYIYLLHDLKHLQTNLDYPDYSITRTFFSGPVYSWILTSCHLENLKLQIDRLNPFKKLLKQRIIYVRNCDETVFEANKDAYLKKKWKFVNT